MSETNTPRIDFDALTEHQVDVLGQITIGNDLGHDEATLRELLDMELIEGGRNPFTGKVFLEMPIWAHIQWCQWCSEKHEEPTA